MKPYEGHFQQLLTLTCTCKLFDYKSHNDIHNAFSLTPQLKAVPRELDSGARLSAGQHRSRVARAQRTNRAQGRAACSAVGRR